MLRTKNTPEDTFSPRRASVVVVAVVALVPLVFGLGVLPLMTGGNDPGWLAGAEALTFGVVAVLGLAGRLGVSRDRWHRYLAVVLAGSVLAAGLSAVFSRDLATSYPGALQWLWLGASGVLALRVAERRRGREWLTGVLIVAVSIQTLWGFYLWLGSRDPTHAQVGTFYAPNQYAGYLILLAPLLVCVCLTTPSRIFALGTGFASAFVYLGIALSGSRGGAVAGGAGLIAVVAMAGTGVKRVLLRSAALLVAVAGMGLLMTGPVFFHRGAQHGGGVQSVLAVKGEDPASLVMRIHWDVGAVQIGRHNVLVGTGLGTFGPVFAKIQKPQWEWSKWAHDQYLESFAEGGLALLAGMVALALVPLLGGFLGLRKGWGRESPWLLGVWGGLVGGSIHLAIDHDWSYAGYGLAFVVMAALAVTPWLEDPPTTQRPPGWMSRIVGVLALVSLLAVSGAFVAGHIAGEPGASDQALRMASILAPYSAQPFEVRAERLANRTGSADLRAAARLLRQALARSRLTNRIRNELAAVYAQLGDARDARSTYAQAIMVAPGDTQGYLAAASFELGPGRDPARAAAILDDGIRTIAPGADAGSIAILLTARAAAAEALAGPSAGLPYAEKATQLTPENPTAWLNLLGGACRAGDQETADTARTRALALGAAIPQGSC
ncbi:MAG TPA: O-antigen ligase family protein [Actinomycetota bacterium]|nr:O-antigen ligase family protein [Actinomycetota bacterium]